MQPPHKILIVRLGAMGDIIHTLPAIATLRRAYPDAELAWAVEERWVELLCTRGYQGERGPQMPLLDRVHVLRVSAWRSAPFDRQISRVMQESAHELRAARYELALDFQGAIKSAVVARVARARRRIGFVRPREAPAGILYTRRVAANGVHMVDQNISLVQAIAPGVPPSHEFEVAVDPAAENWCDEELHRRGTGAFAILTPGAGWGAKQWPPERYGEVARALAKDGLRSLVNHGPGEESVARAVEAASAGTASASSCSVGQLIALTRRARLVIGGDTGPLHLGAALGVPAVGIYGPTDPARNGPYGPRCAVLRSPESRTSHVRRRRTEEGMLNITVEETVAVARRLLEGRRS